MHRITSKAVHRSPLQTWLSTWLGELWRADFDHKYGWGCSSCRLVTRALVLVTCCKKLLVAMHFVTSIFLFLVVMPGATSSFFLLLRHWVRIDENSWDWKMNGRGENTLWDDQQISPVFNYIQLFLSKTISKVAFRASYHSVYDTIWLHQWC